MLLAGDDDDGGAGVGRGRGRCCGASLDERRLRQRAARHGEVDGSDGVESFLLARPGAVEECGGAPVKSDRARSPRLAAEKGRGRGQEVRTDAREK